MTAWQVLRRRLQSLSCCFCDRSFHHPQQLHIHLTHTHPHLRYSVEGSSSSAVFIVTVSRPPLCHDPCILFSWLRNHCTKHGSGRKGKKKAAAVVESKGGSSQRQYFHAVSWLPIMQEHVERDCSGELDMSWLHAEQERMINDFEDVSG